MYNSISRSKWLATTAILAAMASVLFFWELPVPLMPSFIQFDFSLLPCIIGTVSMGPLSGVIIALFKNIIHLMFKGFGATGGVGNLADFVTCLFIILPLGLIYKKFHNIKGLIIGLVVGCFASGILSGLFFNAIVVYPLYDKFLLPMSAILDMYKQIRPSSKGLWEVLAIFNMPYTFLKCVVISIVAVLISKPLESILKRYSAPTKHKNTKDNEISLEQNIADTTPSESFESDNQKTNN